MVRKGNDRRNNRASISRSSKAIAISVAREPSVEKLLAQTTRKKAKEKKARARECPALKEESKTNPKRASKHDRLDHDRRRMDAGSDRFADDER